MNVDRVSRTARAFLDTLTQLHKPLDDLVVADFLDSRLVEDHGPKHGSFLAELVHLFLALTEPPLHVSDPTPNSP